MSPEQIGPRQRLFDLGLDSLMAVELKNRVEKSIGRTFRSTLLFDFPTLEALVDYLFNKVVHVAPSEQMPSLQASIPAELSDEELDELSDDELADLLAEELAFTRSEQGKNK